MAGEYGDEFGRPHYHALLFGHDFEDKQPWKPIKGHQYYRSATLEELWPLGFSSITSVSYQTAAYVARYVMKKITGDKATAHYIKLHLETGKPVSVEPEYNAMSLKPAIGKEWFEKWSSDVFPSDKVIINGTQVRTPRYYMKLLEESDRTLFDEVKEYRKQNAKRHQAKNTPTRLKSRETHAKQKVTNQKRPLL